MLRVVSWVLWVSLVQQRATTGRTVPFLTRARGQTTLSTMHLLHIYLHTVLIPSPRQDAMPAAPNMMAVSTNPISITPNAPECSDVGLVRAARAGDRRASFIIWSRYAAFVHRLVHRFLGPGPDHQDVCQEIFLRVFKRLDELRNPMALQGFILSITLGVARNEVRRRRIRAIVGLVPAEESLETPVFLEHGEAREATRALYQMLDTLGAEDRSLFIARFVEKREVAEVASAHAISLSTAKRRLERLVSRVNARVQSSPVLREYFGLIGRRGRS
jgi:RNA polymerase sigma-70 factor, ECF subfamily